MTEEERNRLADAIGMSDDDEAVDIPDAYATGDDYDLEDDEDYDDYPDDEFDDDYDDEDADYDESDPDDDYGEDDYDENERGYEPDSEAEDDYDVADEDYDDYPDDGDNESLKRMVRNVVVALVAVAVIAGGVILVMSKLSGGSDAPPDDVATSQTTEAPVSTTEDTPVSTTETTTSETPKPPVERPGVEVEAPEIRSNSGLGAVSGFVNGFYVKRDAATALDFFKPGGATVSGTSKEIDKLAKGETHYWITPNGDGTYKVKVVIGQTDILMTFTAGHDGDNWYVEKIITE